jgi:hypothetical protein
MTNTTTTTLKFKRDGESYVATLPNGNLYVISKVQSILLGRFGGGTIHNFWKVEFVQPDKQGRITSPSHGGKRTRLLVSCTKYSPDWFSTEETGLKKLAVVAANAHANGAGNEHVS